MLEAIRKKSPITLINNLSDLNDLKQWERTINNTSWKDGNGM